jgi:hypothetical protein
VVWHGDGDARDAPLTDLRPRDEFFRNTPRRAVIGRHDGDPTEGPVARIAVPRDAADALAAVPGCGSGVAPR